MTRYPPDPFPHLSTNAHVLRVGDQLTLEQINALAHLEHEWIEMRGHPTPETVEMVIHQFICQAMGDCVCTNPKEIW